jgi:hypothetical protein
MELISKYSEDNKMIKQELKFKEWLYELYSNNNS